MHNLVNFLLIAPTNILKNMRYGIRNDLFIHQLKIYLLGTYSATGTILGDRCAREK